MGIVRAASRLGGTRPHFTCPGAENSIPCGRRVVKLHMAGRYFLCRHCYRLGYASQRETDWERAARRANKIKERLGGGAGLVAPLPPRPKGMWRRTYKRLHERVFEDEMRAEEGMECLLARVEGR